MSSRRPKGTDEVMEGEEKNSLRRGRRRTTSSRSYRGSLNRSEEGKVHLRRNLTGSGSTTPTSRTQTGRTRRRSAPPDTYDNVNTNDNRNNQKNTRSSVRSVNL